ncbi:MAG TPA: iron ABC transporter permease [Burkholderiaceae bacterium]|nr:iron ABC transporter permease [Burkholderiaceae bacterium]HPH12396.1 iron ABC transporter permease [Burkholderiaceae bacterium]
MNVAGSNPFARGVAVVLLPAVFLTVMLLAPVIRLLAEGGVGALQGTVVSLWQDDYLRWRVVWSFVQAALTCMAALALGLPVAWVLARLDFPGRTLVLRLLMLPFVVPTLVAALGVLALWGPRGLITGWLGFQLQDTPWLLLYGNLFFNLCVVVRAGVDALGQVSASRVAVARTLGATPWRAFWRVEWPAIAPWLASALCLVFLYCFAGFGLALILGGQRFATVEVEIYSLVAHELKLAEAGALAVCMMVLTGGVALAYAWIEKRLATPARADAIALRPAAGVFLWTLIALALTVLLVFCAAPLLAVLLRVVLAGSEAWAVLIDEETVHALWNTLRFSASALVMATALGLTHALAARRSVWLRASAFLPFVVSPVTVAFGLLLLYPQWTASMALLIAAYALLAYPFVAKSLGAALDSLPVHLDQVARTLGATPWRAFWRVTLPMVMPALRRGMAFAAATALGEFAVSLFLSRPEWVTLTTLIYQRLGRPGAANLDAALVLACLLMVLALAAFLVIESPLPKAGRRSATHLRHA